MSADGPERYVGTTLPGGWKTVKPVGKGNFAWVYQGVGPDGERCAIKILHQRSEQAEKRFLREVKVVSEIPQNPYCVRYKAHGETDDGAPWLAMEFIHGVTLSAILAKGKPIRASELMRLMIQVCRGFAGLHQYGLAHRDVKPDNIMITHPEGSVKLLDFGLVQDSQGLLKLFEEHDMVHGEDFAEDLDHGMLAGTPEYMAPEQISDATSSHDELRTDTTADVYSLGVIFYQLLTAQKLFPFEPTAEDPKGTQREVLEYLDKRLSFTDDDLVRHERIAEPLWTIIQKALRKDPKQRQGTALELAGDIEVYLKTGKGIDNDDLSVTVKGLTGIPQDIIKAARSKHKRPTLQPDGANDFVIPRANRAEDVTAVDDEPPEPVRDPGTTTVKSDPPKFDDLDRLDDDAIHDLQMATSGARWLSAMVIIAMVVAVVVALILTQG